MFFKNRRGGEAVIYPGAVLVAVSFYSNFVTPLGIIGDIADYLIDNMNK